MKVLHILNTDRYSGAENVACQIIEMFADTPDVEMVYCSRDGQIRETLSMKNIKFDPIEKVSVSEIRRLVRKHNPDVLHCHDFYASTFAALAKPKARIVSHLHHNSPWMQHAEPRSILYRLTLNRYDCVLAVSQAIFDEYIFSDRIQKKFVVGNPVNISELSRQYSENAEKDIDLLYLGRLSGEKDPMRFIKLVESLIPDFPELNAALVGDGEQYTQCAEYIASHKLENNIKMYGFQKDVSTFLNRSKIGANTSKWEGFGLSVLENLSYGIPVAASAVGGLKDIVEDSCGRLCTEDSEYLEEIKKLLSDESYYQNKHANAFHVAKKLENIEQYKDILWNIYTAQV